MFSLSEVAPMKIVILPVESVKLNITSEIENELSKAFVHLTFKSHSLRKMQITDHKSVF